MTAALQEGENPTPLKNPECKRVCWKCSVFIHYGRVSITLVVICWMLTSDKEQLEVPFFKSGLVDLVVRDRHEREELEQRAAAFPSIQLSARAACDLELLANGSFSPLSRFMGRADYERTMEEMRLADGTLFPTPITLPAAAGSAVHVGRQVALRDAGNELIGIMRVEEVFEWNLRREALTVYGTMDTRHPTVAEMSSWGKYYVSGELRVLRLPTHFDFHELRLTPAQVRGRLERAEDSNVVAFATRGSASRGPEEFVKRAAEQAGGSLLMQADVGLAIHGDVDLYRGVRRCQLLAQEYFNPNKTVFSVSALAPRMAGPREAVWHAIIRRNYGANHLIVSSDYAPPGCDSNGRPFYAPLAAQELLHRFSDEIGVRVLSPDDTKSFTSRGRHGRGFCIWLTGLPAAGKSSIAEILTLALMEHGRQVTLLDGDVVRTHLSRGLGFSREDRDANILRIGFVASEIARHDGAVICAAVSPYRAARDQVRAMVGADRFIEVFVDTPAEVCAQRDRKGLYAMARAGRLKAFTGIDDPYEAPLNPEIALTTADSSPEENAFKVVEFLVNRGYISGTWQRHRLSRRLVHDATQVVP